MIAGFGEIDGSGALEIRSAFVGVGSEEHFRRKSHIEVGSEDWLESQLRRQALAVGRERDR